MKVVVTGGTGLIGSRFVSLLDKEFEITSLSSPEGVDITYRDSTFNFLKDKKPDIILHLAAKTDVDGCENDKKDDVSRLNSSGVSFGSTSIDIDSLNSEQWKGSKSAFAVNVIGTKNLVDYAKENGVKLVYISTDFIFPGDGEYNEESESAPINWYGQTKYFGEILVNSLDENNTIIVRTSFPYGYKSDEKKDVIWKLIEYLGSSNSVNLVNDQTITPTFIDDIVKGIEFLLKKNQVGIYNVTGSSFVTPLEIGEMIKEKFGLSTKLTPISIDDFYKNRARRPFQSKMKNDKLVHLGFKPKTFKEGFDLIIES